LSKCLAKEIDKSDFLKGEGKMGVGEKLKQLRIKGRKTLKEQSQILGVSLNSVYRWEHDLAAPRKSMLRKIAYLYEVPLEWLLQESEGEEYIRHAGDVIYFDQSIEQQLLRFFRRLSDNEQYKVLGYVERIYVESIDKERQRDSAASGEF
jgi:transcriptional regulator with XRE-family HTH domain